jgi:hypothetical protein
VFRAVAAGVRNADLERLRREPTSGRAIKGPRPFSSRNRLPKLGSRRVRRSECPLFGWPKFEGRKHPSARWRAKRHVRREECPSTSPATSKTARPVARTYGETRARHGPPGAYASQKPARLVIASGVYDCLVTTFQSGATAFELSFAQRRMETSSWMPATETPIGRFAVGARYGHGAGFRSSTRHRGARSRRYDFCDHLGIRGGREAPAHRHFFDDPTSMRAAGEAETDAGHS